MKIILPNQLNEKMQNEEILILDVRAEDKYRKEHISGSHVKSVNIPKTFIFELEENESGCLAELPKEKEIIVTCTTGNSAKKCAGILSEKGYQVTLLEGGLTGWKEFCSKE